MSYSSPDRGRWRREAVTEGEASDEPIAEGVAYLPLHYSANAERSPSPSRGRNEIYGH